MKIILFFLNLAVIKCVILYINKLKCKNIFLVFPAVSNFVQYWHFNFIKLRYFFSFLFSFFKAFCHVSSVLLFVFVRVLGPSFIQYFLNFIFYSIWVCVSDTWLKLRLATVVTNTGLHIFTVFLFTHDRCAVNQTRLAHNDNLHKLT